MNKNHRFVEYVLTKCHRATATLRALRADSDLAARASLIAQLSRRTGTALRDLYLAPPPKHNTVSAAQPDPTLGAGPRLSRIGQLGATAVAVCLLLVVVIAMVMPHAD